MDFFSPHFSISDYRQGLLEGSFSVSEAMGSFLDYINDTNPSLNAFLEVFASQGALRAKELDALSADERENKTLFGVPIALKDNMLVEGTRATGGSRILETYVSSYSATVTTKLERAGAVIVGKTNLDEFAMGSSNESSAFGPVKNPHDMARVPGGSSGGSAAAVASGMTLAALGSDTGGSIRQPASFCGVVGLKPTYGAVSRHGLMALASSLDQIGPFTKTVADSARVLSVIGGHDGHDATSVERDWKDIATIGSVDPSKTVIGVAKEYFVDGMSAEVKKEIERVIDVFGSAGFTIREISLPHTKYALSCYYIILPAEASANLARFDGMRYGGSKQVAENASNLFEEYCMQRAVGFGDEVKRRILLGTHVLSSGYYDAYYTKAQKVRRLIANDFARAFEDGVDVILAPTTPTSAFLIGEKTDDPLAMYLSDIFTIPVNLAGLPSLAVPTRTSYDKGTLPTAFQLIGPHFDERSLFALGHYYETHLR